MAAMRFPVVLFDLDGTLIDSGPIILASFRHATRTVLERDIPADQLLHALDRLGATPAEAAYVGDAPFDVAAAKAGGLFAVAVTWGGIHSREKLEEEHPDAIVGTAEELLGIV